MKNYLIAERYASGLSLAIPEDEGLESALDALRQLSELYQEEHDVRSVLANPAIDITRREAVLAALLERLDVPAVVARAVNVLLRRGRIAALKDVTEVFSMIVDARLNRVRATVTTALDLDPAQAERLGSVLERYSGKRVRLECEVDPAVIGGVTARIGSTVIDGSVRTRLEQMRAALLVEES